MEINNYQKIFAVMFIVVIALLCWYGNTLYNEYVDVCKQCRNSNYSSIECFKMFNTQEKQYKCNSIIIPYFGVVSNNST